MVKSKQKALKDIGRKLRAARSLRGLSKQQMCWAAKIDFSNYNRIENGMQDVRISTLVRLLEPLKLSLKDFWAQKGKK